MPTPRKITNESMEQCFTVPRSVHGLRVNLNLSLGGAKKAISKYRSGLVVVNWIPPEGSGKHLPVYIWRTSPDQVDVPRPEAQETLSGKERYLATLTKKVEKLKHVKRVEILLASTDEEVEQVRIRHKAEYNRIFEVYRRRLIQAQKKAAEYARDKRQRDSSSSNRGWNNFVSAWNMAPAT